MRRMFFCLSVLLLSVTAMHAQWYVSPEMGLASIKRNGFGDSWITGVKVGVGVEYKFNPDKLSLKSGLYYARRGYSLGALEYPEMTTVNKIDRNFLQLPVMLNYSFPLSNDVSLNLAAGPYVGISLKDHWKGGYFWGDKSEFDDLNRFDWGVSAIVGIEINKRWIINLEYDLSLGEESKNDGINANYHTISLSVGYKFRCP